jgi:hypothetical protein
MTLPWNQRAGVVIPEGPRTSDRCKIHVQLYNLVLYISITTLPMKVCP